ncbi:MAG: envelope fusion protein [Bacteroidales bacterium]|nr:envelope fusion protein [Bacteroidales bacterium]MCF8456076.1 envelope fusion protein [Bacteroidales bacterium]
MRTLSISISDIEYDQFGLSGDKLPFSEFVDIVNKEITKQAMNKCIQLAEKYNLSRMTMEEITGEVKAVRNAKNNR